MQTPQSTNNRLRSLLSVVAILLLLGALHPWLGSGQDITINNRTGTADPEGSVAAGVGSLYIRTTGTTNNGTVLYVKLSGTGNTGWSAVAGVVSAPILSGSILMVDTGSCPSGFTEVSTLNGKTLLGTLAANSDVGGTGGADNITPVGTNGTVSFTPSGTNAWPVGVPTAANEASHTHAAGAISWPAGVPTAANESTHTHGIGSYVAANESAHTHAFTQSSNATTPDLITSLGTGAAVAASGTTGAGSAHLHTLSGTSAAGAAHTHTLSWPAGVPTSAATGAGSVHAHILSWPAGTPTFTGSSGTVPAQTFTGSSFDNRSAFVKVIFCKKT